MGIKLYMYFILHGFLEMTLQTMQHEAILHGFSEVMSECQVLLYDL